jgi:hypothetical protein
MLVESGRVSLDGNLDGLTHPQRGATTRNSNRMAQPPKPDQSNSALIKTLTDALSEFRTERKKVECAKGWRDWITILLLIGTTFGVYWQISEMVKVYDPIADQSKAMAKQARATEELFNATKEQQRALISAPNINVFSTQVREIRPDGSQSDATSGYTFIPQFRNLGTTRTGPFTAWVWIQYFDKEVPNNLDLTKPYSDLTNRLNAFIIPGLGTADLSPITITQAYVDKVLNKEGVLLLWGYYEYSDIYEPTKMKQSRTCMIVNPHPPVNGGVTQFTPTQYRSDCNIRAN